MKKINQFFWFCSGANFNILKRAPTENNKYFGIGGAIFFTGILATISAAYALFTIFQSIWFALAFGVIWGLMIFNLDRFIVSSMRKRNHAWSEWKMALPRLTMAIILALVISKPLELKIFEREINRKLDEQKTLMIAESKEALKTGFTEIDDLEIQKDSLKSEVNKAKDYRDKLQQEYDLERFGTKTDGTSGIVGLGSNAKKKEQQLDAAQNNLSELSSKTQEKIDELDEEIKRIVMLRAAEFEKIQPNIDGFDGLAARIDALAVLTSESKALRLANLMIILLFIAVETAPIFVKIISPRGPYDELLDLAEKGVEVYANEKTVKLVSESEERLKEMKVKYEI
ncbi:hypothetical protein Belba_0077 [Belliella baltica DSM 15883]|uniref:DUF4407 domain-containing protein n=1 Tax=Belliella baltica (strain DSM 15883 / CIP 108006 / LMG 21964 / BA134) TaxID=866536 RepID=I3Z0I0_BELBD|nr:DUF4407 domain-containing protein [Belliella baltica]AFL82748.1 hypothetical protein Belba_0077 [Belliella baltica DSM 15883]